MEFEIRSHELSAPKVAALRLAALQTDPDAFGDQYVVASRRTTTEWENWLAERANGNDRELFVLMESGGYVGMCGAGINRDSVKHGFIWGVYIRPDYRGQGGGALLMATAHRWLAARGGVNVEAKVAAPNEVAIKFYRRIGYDILKQDGTLREGSSIPVYPIRIKLANEALEDTPRKLADPGR